ncbi:MAG: hypothetical protein V3V31_02960 [Methylococcales bacterium]
MKTQYNSEVSSGFGKHTAAIIGENDFDSMFGSLVDIEDNDASQLKKAVYEPKDYLQGYLQSAYKTAYARKKVVRVELKGQWSIIVNPLNHEVLIDCDEERLRTYCQQPVSNPISIEPVGNNKPVSEEKVSQSHTMESFLWKVALWSSRGRFPTNIDPTQQVSLIRWPNVTRCTITPHILNISALLVESPHSLLQVADILQIRKQYVFAFFSAAYALGYAKEEGNKRSDNKNSDLIVNDSDPDIENVHVDKTFKRKKRKKSKREAKNRGKEVFVRKKAVKKEWRDRVARTIDVKNRRKGILDRLLRLFRRST